MNCVDQAQPGSRWWHPGDSIEVIDWATEIRATQLMLERVRMACHRHLCISIRLFEWAA